MSVFSDAVRGHSVLVTVGSGGVGKTTIAAAIGLRALAEGVAPPIQNFTARDPACDLDLVIGDARKINSRLLLQNAFAFGGLNVALMFASAKA